MRELVYEGGAVLDRPILRRDRFARNPGDSHAKGATRAFGLGKGAQQRGIAFLRLPTRRIDLFVIAPGIGVEGGEQRDIDDALLCLALDGAAQRAGAAVPPAVMVEPGQEIGRASCRERVCQYV